MSLTNDINGWRDSLVVSVLENDREIGVPVALAAGSRVTTVGQLLFAPWAWVYSTLHPFGVGNFSGYG